MKVLKPQPLQLTKPPAPLRHSALLPAIGPVHRTVSRSLLPSSLRYSSWKLCREACCLTVRQESSPGDEGSAEEPVELLVVADGKLQVARDHPPLPVRAAERVSLDGGTQLQSSHQLFYRLLILPDRVFDELEEFGGEELSTAAMSTGASKPIRRA